MGIGAQGYYCCKYLLGVSLLSPSQTDPILRKLPAIINTAYCIQDVTALPSI